MRGNLCRALGGGGEPGSIPACAGEPWTGRLSPARSQVYPRVCGGTDVGSITASAARGLSPRVRGNLVFYRLQQGHARSIPACAGEPDRSMRFGIQCWVYPRVCGGTVGGIAVAQQVGGLSPRVRGNQIATAKNGAEVRSIPACAGEPCPTSPECPFAQVYPRVCGGTAIRPLVLTPIEGLSPRVRGNRLRAGDSKRTRRSIPACAGEPAPPQGRLIHHQVYPRVCGGTFAVVLPRQAAKGLSPRVRGNPSCKASPRPSAGSIPACAGEPSPALGGQRGHPVYPRVCGGTHQLGEGVPARPGLSPRVRGNPDPARSRCGTGRSIPACAGEPI